MVQARAQDPSMEWPDRGPLADEVLDGPGRPGVHVEPDEGAGGAQLRSIPVELISPRADQPRQTIDRERLEELVASIRERGVLQPIRVRPRGDAYEIIAGERRWRAARQAGWTEIPAIVVDVDDDQAYVEALIENIQREDLNALDRAQALKRLRVNLGLQSWREVGRVVGITRQHVHHLLNVTRLPEPIREDIRVGDLSEKHGRAIMSLRAHPHQQMRLWEEIHEEGLTGDRALQRATALRRAMAPAGPASPARMATLAADAPRDLLGAVDALTRALERATPADIQAAVTPLATLAAYLDEVVGAATAVTSLDI